MANTENKDRSAAAGLGTTAGAAVTEGAAVVALTGGSASASAITYALGTIGGSSEEEWQQDLDFLSESPHWLEAPSMVSPRWSRKGGEDRRTRLSQRGEYFTSLWHSKK